MRPPVRTREPQPGIVDKQDAPLVGGGVDQHDALRERVHRAQQPARVPRQLHALVDLRRGRALRISGPLSASDQRPPERFGSAAPRARTGPTGRAHWSFCERVPRGQLTLIFSFSNSRTTISAKLHSMLHCSASNERGTMSMAHLCSRAHGLSRR